MRAMIETVCRALVDKEDAVEVKETQADYVVVYEVRVAEDDFGKLIGKSGEHANALRLLVKSAGRKLGLDVHVNIVDPKQRQRWSGKPPATLTPGPGKRRGET